MWDLKLPLLQLAFWPSACEQEQTGGRRWVLSPVILIQIPDWLGKGDRDHFQTGGIGVPLGKHFSSIHPVSPTPLSPPPILLSTFISFNLKCLFLLLLLKSVCFSLKHR